MTKQQDSEISYINYFNDYTTPVESMFLSRKMGLIENLRNEFPKIWSLYKQLKSLDWEETEMNIEPCRAEFKQLPTEISNLMIRTLAWQYEADTSATHICDLMSPFVGCTELKCYLIELSKNECVTPDHQVLTPSGWKGIADITTQDKVAQWDYSSEDITFVNPSAVITKEHDGDMYRIYSKDGGVDQLVTPSHRIPLFKQGGSGEYVQLAQDLDLSQKGTFFPTSGNIVCDMTRMTAEEKLYTYVQIAGTVKVVGDCFIYKFTLTDEKHLEAIADLALEADWSFTSPLPEDIRGINDVYLTVPDDFKLKDCKGFDWVEFDKVSYAWANDFLDCLKLWRRYLLTTSTGSVITLHSRKTAEQIATIAHIAGYRAVTVQDKDHDLYTVKLIASYSVSAGELTKEKQQYKGMVHCLTVPTGFFLVKRGDAISVTGNCLHSLAYKVIVESSFDNPEEFLQELVKIKESFQRLGTVKKVFDEVYKVGHEYALGMHKDITQLRRLIFKFWATLYALERIQFMSSFAITFGLAEQGMFVPIAKLVQKICTDEFQVHVQADKAILSNEMAIEANFPAYLEAIDDICDVIKEVTQSELDWLEFLFDGKEEIGGIRKQSVRNFVLYSATEVYNFYNIENPFPEVKEMPLPYMNNWIIIDSNQSSPQEESVSNYLLGGFVDDSEEVDLDKFELGFK